LRSIQKRGILLALTVAVLVPAGMRADAIKKNSHRRIPPAAHHSASSHRASTVKSIHHSATRTAGHSLKRSHGATVSKPHGQREIDNDRAREIQQALIREKYLDGEPSGVWDQSTRQAMTRFQSDNGWQTKLVPDARALIKLGLGPTHTDLIRSSAMDPAVLLPDSARDMRPGGSIQQR